jgi:hypothetical protein
VNLHERRAIHEAGHATAALTFGIPIIHVTIADAPHLHRGRYDPPHDVGLECLVTLCLSGPEAEILFCGPITDDGARFDDQKARDYLARQLEPLQAAAELARCRDSAQRLVRSPWAQQRIAVVADALLRLGTLSGEEILEISSM